MLKGDRVMTEKGQVSDIRKTQPIIFCDYVTPFSLTPMWLILHLKSNNAK